MKNSIALYSLFCLFLLGCERKSNKNILHMEDKSITKSEIEEVKKSDVFYHYSIWWAFVNKVFEGDITAGDLKKKRRLSLGLL